MCKEDILPGLGHDYYLVLTRNENGWKYSYYTGFSNECSPELKAKYIAGVTVEDAVYSNRDEAWQVANKLNEQYKNEGIYIYDREGLV